MKEKISRFIQAFRMNGPVKKRALTIGGIALAVIVAVVLLICLLPKRSSEPQPVEDDTPPVEDPVVVEEPTPTEPDPVVMPEGAEEILEKYPDAYAWLEIPGTAAVLGTPADVSYPVVQHPTDRNYYLDHDLNGNYDKAGSIFSEAKVEDRMANQKDFSDPVTVLYGHNQANRTMFGGLQSYLKSMEFGEDQVIYIYQPDRRITYQIVGGVQYSTNHILYYHDFTDDGAFEYFFSTLWQETDGTTNLDKDNMPVPGDKVLILSVCKNGDDNHRYLVVAKMVEDTADPATWNTAENAD